MIEEETRPLGIPSRDETRSASGKGSDPIREDLVDRMLTELNAHLEELRVAEEELRIQNDELVVARATIEQERKRYQDLFDFAPDAYLVTDALGVIRQANQASVALLGLQAKFLVGKTLISFLPGEERLAFRHLLTALKQPGTRREGDFHVRPRKGGDFPVSLTVAAIREREGEPPMLLWMLRDISERRRAEEERIRLLEEQQARRRHEEALSRLQTVHEDLRTDLAREQVVSHTLQESLLPSIPPRAFPGLALATAYRAALSEAQVGGDFYDAFALPDGRVALVVGDASGKGLQAATRTAEVKFALRAYLREDASDPARAISRLNRYLTTAHLLDGGSKADGFYALVLAVVSPGTGMARIVTAGCELPIILRADGAVDVCALGGGVLGIDVDMVYDVERVPFGPDDTLLLLTDGLTESRRGGVLFGSEGVESVVRRAGPRTPLPDLAERVLEAASEHCGGAIQDDICLLIARCLRP